MNSRSRPVNPRSLPHSRVGHLRCREVQFLECRDVVQLHDLRVAERRSRDVDRQHVFPVVNDGSVQRDQCRGERSLLFGREETYDSAQRDLRAGDRHLLQVGQAFQVRQPGVAYGRPGQIQYFEVGEFGDVC